MLDDFELQQVQQLEVEGDQVWTQHAIPALEGDFLQGLGRRASRIALTGVLTGSEAGAALQTLREKFRAAEPVSFVADITTATRVGQVLIEEFAVRELAGKPERFEYAITLREYTPLEPPGQRQPPRERPPRIETETGRLIVHVIVEGRPDFDYSTVLVTVNGTQEDGADLERTLAARTENTWTEEEFPSGRYTAQAAVESPEAMTGSAAAVVRRGQTTEVTIILRPAEGIAHSFVVHFWFDKAFIEPCMRRVLRRVADYAAAHPNEKLLIVGHTDLVGSDAYNQSLSERRGRSAYAGLTYGRDRAAALNEWLRLRETRPAGETPSIKDSWSVRQYQHILQDLGYYQGPINETHDAATDRAVRAFQGDHGLSADGIVGPLTWAALIEAYLDQEPLAIPESQFFTNCGGEPLKWLGCGEKDPVRNTQDAWRPNRRTEFLFVRADTLPCRVPQPDTFHLPAGDPPGSGWCLGPGQTSARCCFIAREAASRDRWLIQPAEPGSVAVRGRITFEDGTPLRNADIVLTAPDGEMMDGERPSGSGRGRPIPGQTDAEGRFDYTHKPKGVGVWTLEILGPYIARAADEPATAAKGPCVCRYLSEAQSEFNLIVEALST